MSLTAKDWLDLMSTFLFFSLASSMSLSCFMFSDFDNLTVVLMGCSIRFKLYWNSYKYDRVQLIYTNTTVQPKLRTFLIAIFFQQKVVVEHLKRLCHQNGESSSGVCSFQRQINKFSGIIYLLQHQNSKKAMNLMKVSSIKPKIHRYDPKIQSNIPAYRSFSHCGFDKQNNSRKQSRTKIKKESLQNSQVTTNLIDFNDFLHPLSQIQENAMSALTKKAQPRQNEIKTLRQINKDLETHIGSKEIQLNELRVALGAMKQKITDSHTKQIQEIKNLRQANVTLQQRFDEQAHEMQALRRQFSLLKEQLDSNVRFVTNMSSSNIDGSKISNKTHYPNFCQQVCQTNQLWECDRCLHLMEQMEEYRIKYGNELRKLQEQISRLKEKEIIVEVLEQQIQNKNQCIDHLHKNMECMERKSNELLKVIYTLQNQAQKSDYTNHRTRKQFSTPKLEILRDDFY